jgi:hypothetical protein
MFHNPPKRQRLAAADKIPPRRKQPYVLCTLQHCGGGGDGGGGGGGGGGTRYTERRVMSCQAIAISRPSRFDSRHNQRLIVVANNVHRTLIINGRETASMCSNPRRRDDGGDSNAKPL